MIFLKIDPCDLIEALALYTEWIKMYIFVHSRHWSLKKLCNHSGFNCIEALNKVINLTTPLICNTVAPSSKLIGAKNTYDLVTK